jgi:hypothetical protein
LEIGKFTTLHSKVINNKAESNIARFLTEKTGGGSLNVVMGMELGNEPDLGEETGEADAVRAGLAINASGVIRISLKNEHGSLKSDQNFLWAVFNGEQGKVVLVFSL